MFPVPRLIQVERTKLRIIFWLIGRVWHKTVHLQWVCYCTIRYDSVSWVYIRWVFHSLECMVTYWSVLVRVFCEVFTYTIIFLLFELKMPPSGLLIWTENAALRVAFLNWERRLQCCIFEPKMPLLRLLFWTENAVFKVAFLNQKCHVQGCYFESIMLLLWLLVWTENAAFKVVFEP